MGILQSERNNSFWHHQQQFSLTVALAVDLVAVESHIFQFCDYEVFIKTYISRLVSLLYHVS